MSHMWGEEFRRRTQKVRFYVQRSPQWVGTFCRPNIERVEKSTLESFQNYYWSFDFISLETIMDFLWTTTLVKTSAYEDWMLDERTIKFAGAMRTAPIDINKG